MADRNKTIHAFNSQWIGSDLAVFYSQWTLARGWTYPVDILLSPNKDQATVLGAFLDTKGMIHVIFFGGIEQGAEIYYSRAPAANASDARAWTAPRIIGDNAGKLASGALAGDDKGNLFVVYSGNRDGNGLYEVYSTNGGDSWSEPKTVFLTNSNSLWVYAIKSALDSKGQLHAVWTVDNKSGNGDAVYYVRLDVDQQRWLIPYVLARVRPAGYEVDWANVIAYRDELFVIYDDDVSRVMRRSQDNGQTWSEPVRTVNLIGENGPHALVVDSNGVLHMIFGARISSPEIHGAWHSIWDGRSWSEQEAIVSGPRTNRFDPVHPHAVISQGNLLMVTWRTDFGLTPDGVWYSYAMVNAPELPAVVLPTTAATPTFTPTSIAISRVPVQSPTRSLRPVSTPEADGTPPTSSESNPNIGILVAIVPIILLLSALVVVRNLRGPT